MNTKAAKIKRIFKKKSLFEKTRIFIRQIKNLKSLGKLSI